MNVARLLVEAATKIGAALGLEKRESRIEARALACHAWRVDASWLIAHDTDLLTDEMLAMFQTLLSRRLEGIPIAYLVGSREFYGRPFLVSPDVLIPRPDTELLVELALDRIPPDRPVNVLDLGTGSGCIAVTLALESPLWSVTAVDISSSALQLAKENAQRLGAHTHFIQSDMYAELGGQRFDLIVSNPPYIAQEDPHLRQGDVRFEPRAALTSGMDGLDAIRAIAAAAPRYLKPEGLLLMEHGFEQGSACRQIFKCNGFHEVSSHRDLAGLERITEGRLPPANIDH